MRKLTLSKQSRNKTNKRNWVFLFRDLVSLCPENNTDFSFEQEKLSTILTIVESMTGKELNEFADSMRVKEEYQRLYRDGHWLDSPEKYNTKTQVLIDRIFCDLEDFRTEQLTNKLARAVAKAFQ